MSEKERPEILVVDDDPKLRRLIRHHLRDEDFNIREAADGREALVKMENGPPVDLVLLDQNMPEQKGMDTLRKIRANPCWDHTFVLMLTAEYRLDFQRQALRAGAGDFVIKPYDAGILKARITNGLAVAQVRRDSGIDYITGVSNRRSFDKALAREQSRAERYGHPLALIMVDIDHFKQVNDAHGHPAGDIILREFATMIGAHLRQMDLLARFGGDEFIIILPETELAAAIAVAEKLGCAVAEHRFPAHGRLTASFGVAACHHQDSKAALKEVDRALYRAKNAGRNQVQAPQRLINSH